MREPLMNDIERAAQTMLCAVLLDQLDRDEAVNFNSFTIDEHDESGALTSLAIVTVQRPGMKSPIERYHEAEEQRRAGERREKALAIQLSNMISILEGSDALDGIDDEDAAVVNEARAAIKAAESGTLDALLDRWDALDIDAPHAAASPAPTSA